MGYSIKKLQANFWKYTGVFYNYLLHAIYWGSVPTIILYGLFAKPMSPLILAAWGFLTGQEDHQPQYDNPYGMPPQGY
jgi:hypothetical protein